MRRIRLWLASCVVGCTLLLLLSLAIIAFSKVGSRALINTISRVTALDIQYAGGTLLGKLQLSQLRLSNEKIKLELRNLHAELDTHCLWSGQLCLQNLRAVQLEIHALPSSDARADDPGANTEQSVAELITFPVNIEIENLSIDNTAVYWHGGFWRQGQTRAQVSISGSQIIVNDGSVVESYLQLHKLSQDKYSPDSQTATAQVPGHLPVNSVETEDLITLPNIDLPLQLIVNALTLKQLHWDFYGFKSQQQALNLTARWVNTQLQISQAAINDLPRGKAELSGTIEFMANCPLRVNAQVNTAQVPLWEGLDKRTFKLALSGNLAGLALDVQLDDIEQISVQGTLNTLDPSLPFELQASARWSGKLPLRNLPDIAQDLPKELLDINLLTPWQLSAEGTLHTQSFSLLAAAQGLNYQAMALSLNGQHENAQFLIEQLTLHNKANSHLTESRTAENDTAAGSTVEDSALALSGSLSYGEQLRWNLTAESPGFTLPAINQQISGRLVGMFRASGSTNKDDWLVALEKVDLQGDVNGLPAVISGYAKVKNGLQITQSKLLAELNNAHLQLIADESLEQSPQFNLTIDDLSRWHTDAAGSLALESGMTADGQRIIFSGTGQNLRWQNVAINETKIKGHYSLEDLKPSPPYSVATQPFSLNPFALDMRLDKLDLGSRQLHELSIVASGDEQGQSLSLSSHGDIEGTLEIKGKPSTIAGSSNEGWGDG